jgi:uncharacterized protein (DUF1684 family)
MGNAELEITDWRRRVNELYAQVRREGDPAQGHERWRAGRDELFRNHPQSPLLEDDPIRRTGLGYWPYDPALRFVVPIQPVEYERRFDVPTGNDATITLRLIGRVDLPDPLSFGLDVWWLYQYGGGLFIPLRDGTSGATSYGGGRYLLDTAKGADLGGEDPRIVIDMNFAYHPSCRYNPRWVCPLAPAGNTTPVPVKAGETLAPAQLAEPARP